MVDSGMPGTNRWTIHGERVVDDTRRLKLSIASVGLPDGTQFEQYVMRMPKAAMMVVLDEDERVLMMYRHRWIIDRWVWELPGGYVDPDEDPMITAAREVEEETGWRPLNTVFLGSFQPAVGSADNENMLFLSDGASHTGRAPDINEASRVDWIPLRTALDMIGTGAIIGAASQLGILYALRSVEARRQAAGAAGATSAPAADRRA
jgi:8-oxo-dGTP pyrophosphatase MutT (NUDIX family)